MVFSDPERFAGYYNPNRFNALDAGIAFLIAILAMFVVERVYVAAMSPLVMRGVIRDDALLLILGLILPQTVIFLIAFAFLKIRRVSFPTGGGFRKKRDVSSGAFGILLIFGLMYAASPLADQFVNDIYWLGNGWHAGGTGNLQGSPALFVLYLILVAVLPAVGEEMLYRGVILGGLTEWGKIPAVLVSSAMFAFMHGTFEQMIYQFLVGVAIGWVVLETKNYLIGCVMHFANNALAGLVSLLSEVSVKIGLSHLYGAFGCVLGLVCLFAAVLYFAKLSAARVRGVKPEKTAFFYDPKDFCALKSAAEEQDPPFRRVFWADDGKYKRAESKDELFMLHRRGWTRLNRKSAFVPAAIVAGLGILLSLVRVFLEFFGV